MISLQNISKNFKERQILKNFSADFPNAQTSVILGHSGSGKSTLLRSINLLEIPQKGKLIVENDFVEFGAKALKAKQIAAIRSHCAMVFQHFNLFLHLNALENITTPLQIVHKKSKEEAQNIAYELLAKVGLKGYEKNFPAELSGGQAQRVAIARALAVNPSFLLLDEPTAALDPQLTNEVLGVLRTLSAEKKSIIMITHNLNFARLCADKIFFVENGELAFCGSSAEFFDKPSEKIAKFIQSEIFS